MALRDWTKFKGVEAVGNNQISNQIEANLKVFLDWCLLGIGGWVDVAIPTSGAYGGVHHELRLVDDPEYTLGQVWESPRKDWVWETGVEWASGTGNQPTSITGTLINGTGYGTGDATYSHHYNYPLGRVVFDTAIPTTSTVSLAYSYRYVQVQRADDSPWWREIQQRSMRVDSDHVSQVGTGDWSIGAEKRVQLPAIVLEVVPKSRSTGKQLGDGALIKEQDVLFHVIAENRVDRNNLCDIIEEQNDKTIYLFDTNEVAESSAYPLDYRGMLVGSNMYPDFVAESGFRMVNKCTFVETQKFEVQSVNPYLHQGTVRATLEIR